MTVCTTSPRRPGVSHGRTGQEEGSAMRVHHLVGLTISASLLCLASAWAQGGGASQTGSINGKVTDASGAILPGVTVTAASPALMGVQTMITNEQGLYRFPAVPPGVYTLTYELTGFTTARREGISVALGFTATVHVDLSVATMQETVQVTAASPLIDVSA